MRSVLPVAWRAIAALRRSLQVLATERELRALPPEVLRDIGIAPGDIPAVAAGLVQRPAGPQGQPQPESGRGARVIPLPQRTRRAAPCDAPACCAA